MKTVINCPNDGATTLELLELSKERVARLIKGYNDTPSVSSNVEIDLPAFATGLSRDEILALDLQASLEKIIIRDPIIDDQKDEAMSLLEDGKDVVTASVELEKNNCIIRIERLIQTLKEVKAKAYKSTEAELLKMRENPGLVKLRDTVNAKQKQLESLKRDLIMKRDLISMQKNNPQITEDEILTKLEEKSEETVKQYLVMVEEKKQAISTKQRELAEIEAEIATMKEEVAKWFRHDNDDSELEECDESIIGESDLDFTSRQPNQLESRSSIRKKSLETIGEEALDKLLQPDDQVDTSVLKKLQYELDESFVRIQQQMQKNAKVIERIRTTEFRVKQVRGEMEQFSKNEDSRSVRLFTIASGNYKTEIERHKNSMTELEQSLLTLFERNNSKMPTDVNQLYEVCKKIRSVRLEYLSKKKAIELSRKLGISVPENDSEKVVVEACTPTKPVESVKSSKARRSMVANKKGPRNLKPSKGVETVQTSQSSKPDSHLETVSRPIRTILPNQLADFRQILDSLYNYERECEVVDEGDSGSKVHLFWRPDPKHAFHNNPNNYFGGTEKRETKGNLEPAAISGKQSSQVGVNSIAEESKQSKAAQSNLKPLLNIITNMSSRGHSQKLSAVPSSPSTPGLNNNTTDIYQFKPVAPLSTVLPSSPRASDSSKSTSFGRRYLKLKQAEIAKPSSASTPQSREVVYSAGGMSFIPEGEENLQSDEFNASQLFSRSRITDKAVVLPLWSRKRLRSFGEDDPDSTQIDTVNGGILNHQVDEFLGTLSTSKKPASISKLMENYQKLNEHYDLSKFEEPSFYLSKLTMEEVAVKHAVQQMHELLDAFAGTDQSVDLVPIRELKRQIKKTLRRLKEMFAKIRQSLVKKRTLNKKVKKAIDERNEIRSLFLKAINGRGGMPLKLISFDAEVDGNNEELSKLDDVIAAWEQRIEEQRAVSKSLIRESNRTNDSSGAEQLAFISRMSELDKLVQTQRQTMMEQKDLVAGLSKIRLWKEHEGNNTLTESIDEEESEPESEHDESKNIPVATLEENSDEEQFPIKIETQTIIEEPPIIAAPVALSQCENVKLVEEAVIEQPPISQLIIETVTTETVPESSGIVLPDENQTVEVVEEKRIAVNNDDFAINDELTNVATLELPNNRAVQQISTKQAAVEFSGYFIAEGMSLILNKLISTSTEFNLEAEPKLKASPLNNELPLPSRVSILYPSPPRQSFARNSSSSALRRVSNTIALYSSAFSTPYYVPPAPEEFVAPSDPNNLLGTSQVATIAPRASTIRILPMSAAVPPKQKVVVSAPSPIPADLFRSSFTSLPSKPPSSMLSAVLAAARTTHVRMPTHENMKERPKSVAPRSVDFGSQLGEASQGETIPRRGFVGKHFIGTADRLRKQRASKAKPTSNNRRRQRNKDNDADSSDDDNASRCSVNSTATPTLEDLLNPYPCVPPDHQPHDGLELFTDSMLSSLPEGDEDDGTIDIPKDHLMFDEILNAVLYDESEMAAELEDALTDMMTLNNSSANCSNSNSNSQRKSQMKRNKLSLEVREEEKVSSDWQRTLGMSIRAAKSILSSNLLESAMILSGKCVDDTEEISAENSEELV